MKYLLNRIFLGLLLIPIFLTNYSSVYAGSSSLTKWDGTTGSFNLVISLSWIPNTSDRANLETVFKLFAADVYKMTEGKHYVKNLYVYTPNPINNRPREWGKADIIFHNSADAANATVNGFTRDGGRIFIDDNLNDLNEVGHAMAHELGHYAYGLFDEYVANQNRENDPGFPHSTDDAKKTLMAEHWTYQQFSLDSDYSDATKRNTAQWRMFGTPAWGTLVTNPLWDLLSPRLMFRPSRYVFPDLNALAMPTALTQPTNNPAVEIIWMEGSEAVVIIDHSGSMDDSTGMGSTTRMEAAKSGAKSYLDKLKETDYGAVVTYDDSISTIAPLALLDSTTKSDYKSAINTVSPGNMTAIGWALRRGLDILNGSSRKGTFKYIVLLTDGMHNTGESPTGTVLDELAAAGYPVFSIGLGSGADMATLGSISSGTRGRSYYAATGATLNSIYSAIQSMTSDDKLTAWVKDNLNLSKPTKTSSVIVDPSSKKAVFSAAFPNTEAMALSLTMPNSAVVDSTTVGTFSNINYINEPGYIIYEVTDPDTGTWQMQLLSSISDTTNREVVLEAKTDADYSLTLEVTGGTYPEPILIAATPFRNFNIKDAYVTATVTVSGTASALDLKDDGLSPDAVAGDGVYTGAINNYINENYEFNVSVSNPGGTAKETPKGVFYKKGSMPSEVSITDNFTISANDLVKTSGVIADDHGSSFGASTLLFDTATINGKIEANGDIDYFCFDAVAGNSYTVYTTGLFPETMVTLLKLYDNNTVTLLGQDKTGNQGGGSSIIWTPASSQRYYLTVEHGNATGTGNYAVGFKPTQSFDVIFAGNIDTVSPGSAPRIDGHDLYILKRAFGSTSSDPSWNVLADLDGDGTIDGDDLVILAANFAK